MEDDDEPIGRVEEFLEGYSTLTAADYQDETQLAAVARLLGKWHCNRMESVPRAARIFQDLTYLVRQVTEHKVGFCLCFIRSSSSLSHSCLTSMLAPVR